jgi:hypothetical protein
MLVGVDVVDVCCFVFSMLLIIICLLISLSSSSSSFELWWHALSIELLLRWGGRGGKNVTLQLELWNRRQNRDSLEVERRTPKSKGSGKQNTSRRDTKRGQQNHRTNEQANTCYKNIEQIETKVVMMWKEVYFK